MTEPHHQATPQHCTAPREGNTACSDQEELDLDAPDCGAPAETTTWTLYEEENVSELESKLKTSRGDNKTKYDAQTRHLLELLETESNQRFYGFADETEEKLDELAEELPNFKEVIDTIAAAIALSRMRNRPISLTPILIEGGAGVGKSHFANRLSEVLGVPLASHDMANAQNAASLAGSDQHWSNSEIGDVLNTLLTGNHISPVFMLDEIDKSGRGGQLGDPLASLYGLLEAENARNFRDRSLPLRVNAQHIIWIATANDASSRLSKPLLSRFNHFRINDLTRDQRRELAASFINERMEEYQQRTGRRLEVEEAVIDALSALSPRQQKQCAEHMLGQIVRTDSRRFSMAYWPYSLFNPDYEQDIGMGFLAAIDDS